MPDVNGTEPDIGGWWNGMPNGTDYEKPDNTTYDHDKDEKPDKPMNYTDGGWTGPSTWASWDDADGQYDDEQNDDYYYEYASSASTFALSLTTFLFALFNN